MKPPFPEEWPNIQYSSLVPFRGLEWHVQVARPAHDPGPVVLLLHGTGGSTHEWADVLPALARHAIVVAIDLPGHGFTRQSVETGARTEAPHGIAPRPDPMTLPGMAAAICDLMLELGLAPAVIAGHSAGAAVALRMALDAHGTPRGSGAAPQAVVGFNPALVPPPAVWEELLAPVAGLVMESSWLSRGAAWASGMGGITRAVLESSGARLTAPQLARYARLFASPQHCGGALSMMSRWNLPALIRDAAGLTIPFTAYAGARDLWVPARALATQLARFPRTTLIEVPNVGHLLPEEAPTVAVQAIQQLL